MVSDFASQYGIRLHQSGLSWAEFRDLLTGLLQIDSRLWRHFTKDDEEADDDV